MLEGKGKTCCLAKGQAQHIVFELHFGKNDKVLIFRMTCDEGCPNLACHSCDELVCEKVVDVECVDEGLSVYSPPCSDP